MKLMTQIEAILRKYGLAEDEKEVVQEMRLEDGTTVKSSGEFSQGDDVYVENEEGEAIPLPTGEYTTEDGKTLQVEDGVVVGGDVGEEEMEEEEEEVVSEEGEKPTEESAPEEEIPAEEPPVEEEEEEKEEEEEELKKQLYSRTEVQKLLRKVVKDLSAEHRQEVAMLKKRINKQKQSLSKPAPNRVRRRAFRQEDPTKQYEPKAMGSAFDIFNQYK